MDHGPERIGDPSTCDRLQRKGLAIRGWALLVAAILTAAGVGVPS